MFSSSVIFFACGSSFVEPRMRIHFIHCDADTRMTSDRTDITDTRIENVVFGFRSVLTLSGNRMATLLSFHTAEYTVSTIQPPIHPGRAGGLDHCTDRSVRRTRAGEILCQYFPVPRCAQTVPCRYRQSSICWNQACEFRQRARYCLLRLFQIRTWCQRESVHGSRLSPDRM